MTCRGAQPTVEYERHVGGLQARFLVGLGLLWVFRLARRPRLAQFFSYSDADCGLQRGCVNYGAGGNGCAVSQRVGSLAYQVGRFGGWPHELHEDPDATSNSEIWQYLSDQARTLTDAAVWTQARDLARAALHGKVFDDIVAELTRARSEIIEGDPVVAVEKIGEGRGLTERERGGVLRYLIEGGDLTKWGLHSAITRYSQDVEDYQRASELKQVGGEIITLGARGLPALVAA